MTARKPRAPAAPTRTSTTRTTETKVARKQVAPRGSDYLPRVKRSASTPRTVKE